MRELKWPLGATSYILETLVKLAGQVGRIMPVLKRALAIEAQIGFKFVFTQT